MVYRLHALVLHAFRFIGLSFLVPGVVSPDLPIAFARDAAYGDIVAAILALAALATLRSGVGIALAWRSTSGARLVTASEPAAGTSWNWARIIRPK